MVSTRAATVLQDSVLETVGQQIVWGTVGSGHRYTLEGLQEDFEISRTVARDVMRVLDSLGLVTPRRSVGVVVNPPESWNVYAPQVIHWRLAGPQSARQFEELTDLRIAVEPLAARAAAAHATTEDRRRISELGGLLRTLGEAGDLEAFLEADMEFHTRILTCSGNSMFAALSAPVGEVLSGRTHAGLMPFKPVPEALREHEELAAAIHAGDGERAELAARAIATEVHRALVDPEV